MTKRRKKKRVSSKKRPQKRENITPKLSKIHFNSVENLAGFILEIERKENMVNIQTCGSLVSDDPRFYIYIEEISKIFLQRTLVNAVYQFLVIIHEDLSADLYVNDIPVTIMMRTKRPLQKGELVWSNDIIDIERMVINNIKIIESDKIIYCFKTGWKFALFFDLNRKTPLDIEKIQVELGALYRYLSFQYVYDVLDSKPHFDSLLKDGWFPFIELLSSDFKEISESYKDTPVYLDRVKRVVDKFDKDRINRIATKWWNNPIFLDKKQILEAGINSYIRDDNEGFISCIKTILPEIEGIIRLQYFKETGKGKSVNIADLISYITKKGSDKTGSDLSLFLPRAFLDYLKMSIFPNFNIETGEVPLSRHSSSHGVVKAEEYTKSRALQMILILDQVYFYI